MPDSQELDYVLTKWGKEWAWMSGELDAKDPAYVRQELRVWSRDVQRGFEIKRLPRDEAQAMPWANDEDRKRQDALEHPQKVKTGKATGAQAAFSEEAR